MAPARASRVSRASPTPSWPDSDSEFDDLITPCPSDTSFEEATATSDTIEHQHEQHGPSRLGFTGTGTGTSSFAPTHDRIRPCSADPSADIRSLWAVMLALQQRYQCYKSTRMRIAADSDFEEASELMRMYNLLPLVLKLPSQRLTRDTASRACIDYLNDSIEFLPEEGWKMLEPYLVRDNRPSSSKPGMQQYRPSHF